MDKILCKISKTVQKSQVSILALLAAILSSHFAFGQFVQDDTTMVDPAAAVYQNHAAGEFTPGKGFQLAKNDFASLNISLYGMVRYLNQMSEDTTWTDHKGTQQAFDGRNDIYWHRVMIWFSGYLGTPRLTYMATAWTVTTTQQTLVYGNLQYNFNKHFTLGAGITPNACIRSLQGSFPFFTSTDRTMAEDALRGGFTNGVFLTGEILPRLRYMAVLGNNLSILGVKAANLTRNYSKSVSLNWMPTTGEFGPRGGNGDFEHHDKMATRIGASYCESRENRFNNTGTPGPDNTQVRLSDGLLFFETGALAPGVTIIEADYKLLAMDLGLKYKGFAFHSEFYYRTLSDFYSEGVAPIDFITDYGFTLQAMHMIMPKLLCGYVGYSGLVDQYNRNPYEIFLGVNVYPTKTRSFRINAQYINVYKAAGGGTFGLYTSGQTGGTITIGADILL